MSTTDLALDIIRKKVFFHNSIDVWISACEEKKTKFADILAETKDSDPNTATYTIKLNNDTITLIREFTPED